jgi:hypothetical protein
MRVLGMTVIAAALALAACAGPSDTTTADNSLVYRTGSRLKQPDVAQPTLSYYGPSQLSQGPDQTIGGVLSHAPATPVPPPPEAAPQ